MRSCIYQLPQYCLNRFCAIRVFSNMPGKRKTKESETKDSPKGKKPKGDPEVKASPAAKKNKVVTDWDSIDFSSSVKTGEGKAWNLKLSSWNVDGLRACCTKGGADYLKHEMPDVLCLQETKVSTNKLPEEIKNLPDYPYCYWLAAEKEGYSSVGNNQFLNCRKIISLFPQGCCPRQSPWLWSTGLKREDRSITQRGG